MDREWDGIDRRHKPKHRDTFYRFILLGNGLTWCIFVCALLVFHYARPEQITGIQRYWGIAGREEWHANLTIWLLSLLAFCTLSSFSLILMHARRNRRKHESYISNMTFLSITSFSFTVWILQMIG